MWFTVLLLLLLFGFPLIFFSQLGYTCFFFLIFIPVNIPKHPVVAQTKMAYFRDRFVTVSDIIYNVYLHLNWFKIHNTLSYKAIFIDLLICKRKQRCTWLMFFHAKRLFLTFSIFHVSLV